VFYMTAAIHNSYSAIVPAVYGTATPVIDVGHGPSSVNATAALTDAGSIVVNLGSAPPGAVTYTVSGLAHEMSRASPAPSAAPVASALADAGISGAMPPVVQNAAPPIMASGQTGVYDDSGSFQPVASGLNHDAVPDTGSVVLAGAPGGLISTQA